MCYFFWVLRKVHRSATDEEISTPIKIWLVYVKKRMIKEIQRNVK